MAGAMTARPPWSHELRWMDIQRGVAPFRLVADGHVRDLLARTLGLEAISSLGAELAIKPWRDGIELSGRVTAAVTQRCGVSLEPFDEAIDEPVSVKIVPANSPNVPQENADAVVIDLQTEDPPDSLQGDSVDVAGYVIEHLSLALAPFPRKPGAVFTPPAPQTSISPFSVLAKIKQNLDE